jgi:hypothetical protein
MGLKRAGAVGFVPGAEAPESRVDMKKSES